MISIGLLLVLVVVMFVVLCYVFNKSKVELEFPTIAAMEAQVEMVETEREAAGVDIEEEQIIEPNEKPDVEVEETPAIEYEEEPIAEEEEVFADVPDAEEDTDILDAEEGTDVLDAEEVTDIRDVEDSTEVLDREEVSDVPVEEELVLEEELVAETIEPPSLIEVTDYEYRVMLEEGGDNYVLPQWMLNFFSSSDICHTLDPSDNMVIISKLNNAENAEAGVIDISADCDMGTQTVALKLCFGEGADSETFKTKFYLFERGDLFELGRLVRQSDIRIDILTRGADYTLEYLRTIYCKLPHDILEKIKDVLSKNPG